MVFDADTRGVVGRSWSVLAVRPLRRCWILTVIPDRASGVWYVHVISCLGGECPDDGRRGAGGPEVCRLRRRGGSMRRWITGDFYGSVDPKRGIIWQSRAEGSIRYCCRSIVRSHDVVGMVGRILGAMGTWGEGSFGGSDRG